MPTAEGARALPPAVPTTAAGARRQPAVQPRRGGARGRAASHGGCWFGRAGAFGRRRALHPTTINCCRRRRRKCSTATSGAAAFAARPSAPSGTSTRTWTAARHAGAERDALRRRPVRRAPPPGWPARSGPSTTACNARARRAAPLVPARDARLLRRPGRRRPRRLREARRALLRAAELRVARAAARRRRDPRARRAGAGARAAATPATTSAPACCAPPSCCSTSASPAGTARRNGSAATSAEAATAARFSRRSLTETLGAGSGFWFIDIAPAPCVHFNSITAQPALYWALSYLSSLRRVSSPCSMQKCET